MKIEVNSFFDIVDNCTKYYSTHGEGWYCDCYEEALRDELIGVGILKPIQPIKC